MGRLTKKQKHILSQKLCDMKNRCSNPRNRHYKDYGGRGIKVCDEWADKKQGHKNFQNWAVESGWKEGLSIDRKNNDGNYEPSNCRWATPKEQARNRRPNNLITICSQTKTLTEWAEMIGITPNTLKCRIEHGWKEEDLLKPKTKSLKMTKAQMTKEIKMYRHLEEQGLLFRLPCKVGDTVYKVWYKPCHKGEDYPDSYSCCGCEDDCDLELTIFDFVVPSLGWILNHIGQFGDYVWFLTREEAEKALAERGK